MAALEKAIQGSMQLQHMLASHYILYKQFKIDNSTHFIFENNTFEEQISALTALFGQVCLRTDSKIAQVSGYNPQYLNLFENMVQKSEVNPIISHLLLKMPCVFDVQQPAFYKYQPTSSTMSSQAFAVFCKDDFVQYVLSSVQTNVEFSLLVNGFTLDELSNDMYIQALSQLFTEIYLQIYMVEINGEKHYMKSLRFYCNAFGNV